MNFVVAAFYHFADFPDYQDAKNMLRDFCVEAGIKGTILLSCEGVNSTVAGAREGIDSLRDFLSSDPRFCPIESWRETHVDFMPFTKMKVRLKKELVALGVEDIDMSSRGEYIDPLQWDDFISSDDVCLIDTRNDYEIKYGTFRGAVDPQTRTFREFPSWMEKWAEGRDRENTKVAMVCTGGIRCEKSTAYVKNILGFKNVYHLKGGILGYLERVSLDAKTWDGSCFVFDNRVAVDNKLEPVDSILCALCGSSMDRGEAKEFTKSTALCSGCSTAADVNLEIFACMPVL